MVALRLEPALVEDVKRYTDDFTAVVETLLAQWVQRAKQRATVEAKSDQLAKCLQPADTREVAASEGQSMSDLYDTDISHGATS